MHAHVCIQYSYYDKYVAIASQLATVFRNQKHDFEHNRLVLGIMLKSIIGYSKSIIGPDLVLDLLHNVQLEAEDAS